MPGTTATQKTARMLLSKIAINPIASSILGETNLSKIQIPVMIVTGSADTVAPALLEQIQPFTWLTSPNKYLVMMKNGTHFSTIEQSPQSVFLPPTAAIGPEPALARRYVNGHIVAFMESYLNGKSNFSLCAFRSSRTPICVAVLCQFFFK